MKENNRFFNTIYHRILKKGAALLFSIGSKETGSDGVWDWDEFQSVPMYWSYHNPKKSLELLKEADFEIIFARYVDIMFEGNPETHCWILARTK
ncbi:MAG: hypothetical protein ACTSV2_12550 [Candidatus Thorarchaeota archaeon]